MKNVGGDQMKPLKMQKMLLIENLAMRRYNQATKNQEKDIVINEERMMSMNYRLI